MEHTVKQVIFVRKDLHMRLGKIAAQVAHASMEFLLGKNSSKNEKIIAVELTEDEVAWCSGLFTKIVCYCNSQEELEQLMLQADSKRIQISPIWDAGLTEFNGVKTLTCCAFGPCKAEYIDPLTGHLKLA